MKYSDGFNDSKFKIAKNCPVVTEVTKKGMQNSPELIASTTFLEPPQ